MLNTEIICPRECSINITVEEVEKSVKELKSGKAPGPGNIPGELLKNGTPKLMRMIQSLMDKSMNIGDVPNEWKIVHITPIHKKGRKDICRNYRGIAVTNTFSKIYGRILRNRLEREYVMHEEEEQSGFRAGRSCIDNLFCLSQVMQKKWQTGRELHIVFLDIAQAYDNVPVNKLWEVLRRLNLKSSLIAAVKELYSEQAGIVKVGKHLTESFPITKGLRQGCCISPTLFKIYVNEVLQKWKRSCAGMGIPLDMYSTLYTLQFADDQVIVAHDQDDIEFMLIRIRDEYAKWGLTLNLGKTMYWALNTNNEYITMGTGNKIKKTEEIKYLGVKIGKQGLYETEVLERIKQGRKLIGSLNSVLWDKNISKKTKLMIYRVIIQSVLYGAEIWQLSEQMRTKLRVMEMDFLRRSAGISRREKIRNERIKEIMGLKQDILHEIEWKQLLWFGHVQRMRSNRLPKKLLDWQPQERRKRGRPRPGWRDNVEKTLAVWQIPPGTWNNREEWKKKLGAVRPT